MGKQPLVVMAKDGKFTLSMEMGVLTLNVPNVNFQIPRIGGDVYNHVGIGVPDKWRFLRPIIIAIASALVGIGFSRLHF